MLLLLIAHHEGRSILVRVEEVLISGCGYVIVKGPFANYKEGMISDKDGEMIAEGCAYLGKGATVNKLIPTPGRNKCGAGQLNIF